MRASGRLGPALEERRKFVRIDIYTRGGIWRLPEHPEQ